MELLLTVDVRTRYWGCFRSPRILLTFTSSRSAMSVRKDSVDSPLFVVRACVNSNDSPSRGYLEARLVRT